MIEAGKKRGGKRRILLVVAALLVLCGGAAGAWYGGLFSRGGGSRHASVAVDRPVLVDLPDMISNLDTGGRRASFVKVHVKLQVAHAAHAKAITEAEPELVDLVQSYLRVLRPDDLKGGIGTYRLREALMYRIDARLAPVQVTDLLFTQLLVQ